MDLATLTQKILLSQMRKGREGHDLADPRRKGYIDVLTPMLEAGEDVLFVNKDVLRYQRLICLWSDCRAAAASEEFPTETASGRYFSASLGEGLLIMRAVNCRREGCVCIDEILIRRFARRVTAWRRSLLLTICAIWCRTGRLST